nr:MAG TPA: hypothetical protein [Bacteriophage sp.]
MRAYETLRSVFYNDVVTYSMKMRKSIKKAYRGSKYFDKGKDTYLIVSVLLNIDHLMTTR